MSPLSSRGSDLPPSQDMRSLRRAVLPFLMQAPAHRWRLCDLSQAALRLPCGLRSRSPVQTVGPVCWSAVRTAAPHHAALPPQIWHHSFYQLLHTAPEQHPLMLTEPPLNTMSNKEKVSEVRSQVVGGGQGAGRRGQGHPRDLTFALLSEINSPVRAVHVDIWARTSAAVQRPPGSQTGLGVYY